jgi:hypothetical protein
MSDPCARVELCVDQSRKRAPINELPMKRPGRLERVGVETGCSDISKRAELSAQEETEVTELTETHTEKRRNGGFS